MGKRNHQDKYNNSKIDDLLVHGNLSLTSLCRHIVNLYDIINSINARVYITIKNNFVYLVFKTIRLHLMRLLKMRDDYGKFDDEFPPRVLISILKISFLLGIPIIFLTMKFTKKVKMNKS